MNFVCRSAVECDCRVACFEVSFLACGNFNCPLIGMENVLNFEQQHQTVFEVCVDIYYLYVVFFLPLPVCDVSTHNCLVEEHVQLSRLARTLHCWSEFTQSVAHGLYCHGLYAALYVITNRLASSVTVIATNCVIFTCHLMNEKLTLMIWLLTSWGPSSWATACVIMGGSL